LLEGEVMPNPPSGPSKYALVVGDEEGLEVGVGVGVAVGDGDGVGVGEAVGEELSP